MNSYKFKELNMYHNSLAVQGKAEGVGESISLQKRLNPQKRMFVGDQNLHMRNQIHLFGSMVEAEEKQKEAERQNRITTANLNQIRGRSNNAGPGGNFQSEYNRTIEESMKMV